MSAAASSKAASKVAAVRRSPSASLSRRDNDRPQLHGDVETPVYRMPIWLEPKRGPGQETEFACRTTDNAHRQPRSPLPRIAQCEPRPIKKNSDPYLPAVPVVAEEGQSPPHYFSVTITPRRLLTAKEAADYCGITQKQLRFQTGIAPVALPNSKQLFDIRDLDRFIESCKSPSAALSDDDILARL